LKAFIFKFKVKSDYKTQMIVYMCYAGYRSYLEFNVRFEPGERG